jgi:Tfp pilus assembly protein PilN
MLQYYYPGHPLFPCLTPPIIPATVSELNGELQKMKDERDTVKERLGSLNESHTHLSHQFEKLMATLPAHVTLQEHQEVLANIQK